MFARILKANPYHDEKGRFAPKDNAASSQSEAEQSLKDNHGVSIAAPGSALDSMVGGAAYGGPIKRKTARDNASWDGNVRDLGKTMDDLSSRFGIDFKKVGVVLLSRDSATQEASGMAAVGGTALSFSGSLQDRKAVARDKKANDDFAASNNGRQWGVPESLLGGRKVTEKARSEYAQAVMRHEIGHLLTQPQHVAAFKTAMADMGAKRVWAKDNISVYGATKTIEALAESFALYTDKSYKAGRLPSSVESIMADMIKTAGKNSSQKAEEYIPATQAHDNVGDDADWDDEMPKVEEAPKGFRRILKSQVPVKPV